MTADVVIVGGGVIGAALFAELARDRTTRVVLLEQTRFGAGATGASGGILRALHTDPRLTDLALESLPTYLHFQSEVGGECGYAQTGVLHLLPASRAASARAEAARLNAQGWRVEALGPDGARDRFPGLRTAGVGAALWEPDGGYADPLLATRAWIRQGRERGGAAWEGARVERIVVAGGRVRGVRSSAGTIAAPAVVVAAGAWSARLLAEAGWRVPLRAKRIQVHFFRRPAASRACPAFNDETTGLYGRPEAGGLFLVGYPVDDWDVDPDVAAPVARRDIAWLRRAGSGRLPWLRRAACSGGRRSFDAFTPDERGLAVAAPGVEGLVAAAGWSGVGFKLAPAAARRAAAVVRGGARAASAAVRARAGG